VQLLIDQKLVYPYLKQRKAFFGPTWKALFSNSDLLSPFILELTLAAIHPNLLTKDLIFSTHD
jgi:hypothetical protein